MAKGRSISVKRKPRPIFDGLRRRHKIDQILDRMRDWRLTPFENEGACRAGLRSALCLEGYGWHRADEEAAGLVAEALRLMGAVRPTWEQGQREYSVPRENCTWCCRLIPEELQNGTRPPRFCSDVCARAALQHRDFEVRAHDDAMYYSALDVIRRFRFPARDCVQCGKQFRTFNWEGFGVYCSRECYRAAKSYIQERECPCCGKRFRPKQIARLDREVGLFCSKSCRYAAKRPARDCVICGDSFQPRSEYSFFCSPTCNKRAYKIRTGMVKTMSPPVFDYIFRMAA